MNLHYLFNRYLDKLVSVYVRIGHRSWHAFRFFGFIGMTLAILLALILTTYLSLSALVMSGIILSSMLTFFGVILITKVIAGYEEMVYYHHEIAVLAVASLLLWLLRQPVLPYLDVTILGVGMFLTCGRMGCLMAGCCHGMPASWGVCYSAEHAASGVSPHFVGVRLLPIQAFESLWVFCTVIVGVVLVTTGQPPGVALAWYVVTYGLGRFFFEFMRGDTERRYYLGFSEAQWTSLLLMSAVVWAGLGGTLIFHLWYLGATAFLGLTMIVVTLRRVAQGTDNHLILLPQHMHEFAEAVQLASNFAIEKCDVCKQSITPMDIHIGCTSLGIQVSASRIRRADGVTHHYSLSCQNGTLTEKTAGSLSRLILQIKHPSDSGEIVKGGGGVFHLLVHSQGETGQEWRSGPN